MTPIDLEAVSDNSAAKCISLLQNPPSSRSAERDSTERSPNVSGRSPSSFSRCDYCVHRSRLNPKALPGDFPPPPRFVGALLPPPPERVCLLSARTLIELSPLLDQRLSRFTVNAFCGGEQPPMVGFSEPCMCSYGQNT